jgi:ribosomal-protein-alanine N-acetyltransferase
VSPIVIAFATATDVPRLRVLGQVSAGFDAEAELAREWAKIWVARTDAHTEVAGFALTWRAADEVHLLDLVVDEPQRRRGLGRSLLDALIADARSTGGRIVLLEARASNEPALALYRSAGFFVTDVRRAYYSDNGEDAVVMRLELDPTHEESDT